MALLGTLQVRLGLDTASFGQKFNGFAQTLEKQGKGLAKSLSGLTNFGSLIGSAGISAAIGKSVSDAATFEQTLNQVGAASDLTGAALKSLGDYLRTAGIDLGFGPLQSAAASLELVKAGSTAADIQAGQLAATMRLAATEGIDLARAAQVVTEQLGAFHITAANSSRVTNALAGASVASTASVDSLAQGLSQVAAVAANAGSTIEDTAGTLALLASKGIAGSDAGTSLKTMFLGLVPQTKAAKNTMDAYGISFTRADGSIRSLTEVADILQAKLGQLSAAQQQSALKTIFGTDAFRSAAILTRSGAKELQGYIDAAKDQSAAAKLSDARMKGLTGSLSKLKSAFENLGIELANGGFLQALTSLADTGSRVVSSLAALPQWAKNLGVGLAIAAAAIPPLAFGLSTLVTVGPALLAAWPTILTGLTTVATFLTGPWAIAIAAAGTAVFLLRDRIASGIASIRQWFADWVTSNQPVIAQLQSAWQGFASSFGPLWSAAKAAVSSFGAAVVQSLGIDASGSFTSLGELAGSALTGIVQGATWAINGLTSFVTWLTANIPAAGQFLTGLATSGIVAFQSLSASLGEAWTSISSGFSRIVGYLTASFLPVWESLKSLFAEVGRIGSELAGIALTAIGQKLTFLQPLLTAAQAAIGVLGDKFRGLVDIATNISGALITAFKALVDRIAATFRDFPWGELGQAIVTGLANGIKSKIDIARSAISTVGQGVITSAKNALEIKSPSRVFFGIGEFVGQGFIDGIQSMSSQASAAIRSLVSAPKTGQLSFSQGFSSSFAPRAIEINERTGKPFGREQAKEFSNAWTIALRDADSAIDDFVKSGRLNFKGMVDSIIQDLAAASLKGALRGLFTGIGSSFGSGGSGNSAGGWGSIFGSVIKGLSSFEGGGETGQGSRTGGLDGRGGRLAMLHPRETVIDHTKVRSAALATRRDPRGGGLNLTVPVTVNPGVSRDELSIALQQVQSQIIQIIPSLVQRGGAYANAFAP